MLGPTLVSLHNLRFFARLMSLVRQSIAEGTFAATASRLVDGLSHGESV
jgi:queuine/archaeosine tRNA-ribosyltransferase